VGLNPPAFCYLGIADHLRMLRVALEHATGHC
jgi:hypothetical protein